MGVLKPTLPTGALTRKINRANKRPLSLKQRILLKYRRRALRTRSLKYGDIGEEICSGWDAGENLDLILVSHFYNDLGPLIREITNNLNSRMMQHGT
jgi:hypothetical protein